MRAPADNGRGRIPVSQDTVQHIQRMLLQGELKPGDRLPSQRDLSIRLRISRTSLREALSVLEVLGLLRTEPGRGTFVANGAVAESAEPRKWRFAGTHSEQEVYELRYVLEGHAARLAAAAISATQLQELRHCCDAMHTAIGERDLVGASFKDFEFHALLMRFSGNRLFLEIQRILRNLVLESQRLPMALHTRLKEPLDEHDRILAALERRDPKAAAAATQDHIRRAAARVGINLRLA